MAKRTRATDWHIVVKDATGTIAYVKYTCPYCDFENSENFFCTIDDTSSFDVEQTCEWCGKDVLVECD